MAWARDVIGAFDEFRTDVEEVRPVGGRVAVALRLSATPLGAGGRVERREAHLWTFDGDRPGSLREYATLSTAVEAAGELDASHADRVRAGIEAYNSRDFEQVLATLAEDVEWKRVDGLPDEGGTVHGRDGVRELFVPEAWARQRLELLEMVEDGATVLVHGIFHAEGVGSGIELDVETYVVYRFDENGLATHVENWRERADAERSSGLQLAESQP